MLIVVKTRNAARCMTTVGCCRDTVSSPHSILPPISLSLSVSHFSCVLFCFPLPLTLWLSYSWQGWLYCLWGRISISSLCNVNIGNTTHDGVQISSTADTFLQHDQSKIKFENLLKTIALTTTGSALTCWVMHLRCHFKNLPSSKQSKTCFYWPFLKTGVRGPN